MRTFESLRNALKEWMSFENITDFPLRTLSTNHIYSFFQYLQVERKLANKTYNNFRGNFTTALKYLQRNSPGLFKVFPMDAIDKLPVHVKRNAAFSATQIQAIVKEANKLRYKLYIVYTQFMYYTLARPKELADLRVDDNRPGKKANPFPL